MKILIIEDDAEILEFMSIAFEVGWPEVEIISTHHGATGLEFLENQSPDAVILDLGLPDMSGFEVLKQIRAFSSVPTLIVSVRGGEADVVKGLEWGADEYIVKPFGQLELLARMRAVLRRTSGHTSSGVITSGPISFNPASRELSCQARSVRLTNSESLLMQSLLLNAGNVVTFTQLAETLWGDEYPGSMDALRVNIRRIRAKVEPVIAGVGHLESSPGIGYILSVQ